MCKVNLPLVFLNVEMKISVEISDDSVSDPLY